MKDEPKRQELVDSLKHTTPEIQEQLGCGFCRGSEVDVPQGFHFAPATFAVEFTINYGIPERSTKSANGSVLRKVAAV
jgi:hypothetical protein